MKGWRKGIGVGEGGVSGDDVTWVMTSSGSRKREYFGYKYMKVYGGSRCKSVEKSDGVWRGGVSVDDVT